MGSRRAATAWRYAGAAGSVVGEPWSDLHSAPVGYRADPTGSRWRCLEARRPSRRTTAREHDCEDSARIAPWRQIERSPQLAVFAPAPVVAAEGAGVAIPGILAGKAQADTGDRVSAGLRNLGAAFGAMTQTRTLRQTALRTADRILDRRIYLILHRAFFCPARSHTSPASDRRWPNSSTTPEVRPYGLLSY